MKFHTKLLASKSRHHFSLQISRSRQSYFSTPYTTTFLSSYPTDQIEMSKRSSQSQRRRLLIAQLNFIVQCWAILTFSWNRLLPDYQGDALEGHSSPSNTLAFGVNRSVDIANVQFWGCINKAKVNDERCLIHIPAPIQKDFTYSLEEHIIHTLL
jgi:hypothetical protein